MSERYVLDLGEAGAARVALAGGKAANLGELTRIEGVRVPAGFCVTTDAFRLIMATAPGIDEPLDRLSGLDPENPEAIRAVSARIRRAIEDAAVPGDLADTIIRSAASLGGHAPCAVRSSATAEDLPGASFAGQQDSYLNVTGPAAVLRHVRKCWASLFTERAVTYRLRGGFDHRKVRMAVVVQRMVLPRASGVMFTADPVTSSRETVSVEAVPGPGEALVSGRVNADVYTARDGEITVRPVDAARPVLDGTEITRLTELGRRIEAHFGRPQDIEWCLDDSGFSVVQSRPVTTLFPVPETGDAGRHVYLSVGHQQMMTDAMKPLGISLWQLTAMRPMLQAGGRLFVDVTRDLASPATRARFVQALGAAEPLTGDALRSVIERGFIPDLPDEDPGDDGNPGTAPVSSRTAPDPAAPDPAGPDPAGPDPAGPGIVAELTERGQASLDALKRAIGGKSGPDLLDFILADIRELKRILSSPRSAQAIRAGMRAAQWLNEHMLEWLGEKNAAGPLTQSAPGNVTSEMGLALLDVADAIRPYPDVVTFLEHAGGDAFLDELPARPGGQRARAAIEDFLGRYGMRCVGEIDVTRPRWSEDPGALVPVLLGHVRESGPGEGRRRFEQGLREARAMERDLLSRLRALPGGERKAAETKRMIDQVRALAGYREYPKYHIVSRFFVYKQALLEEAGRLAGAGVLRSADDIFYLTLGELGDVVRAGQADDRLIRQRRHEFRSCQALAPPRVLTSDGEAVTGEYRRDGVPDGALTGLPVSAGVVEGRARVVLDLAGADLGADDILVTACTDPGWTPAFVSVKGLVTEVGGLMTHGAVIAREYGLPAVVGVEHATRLIRDGQRIRVHGTDGYVELLTG